jgi:hypothetical protein
MKLFLLVALFSGIILILTNELASSRPERVEYRYIPRDLDELLRTAPLASDVYSPLFKDENVK